MQFKVYGLRFSLAAPSLFGPMSFKVYGSRFALAAQMSFKVYGLRFSLAAPSLFGRPQWTNGVGPGRCWDPSLGDPSDRLGDPSEHPALGLGLLVS